MKSYISRKLPLETRTTDQILDLRSSGAIIWLDSFETAIFEDAVSREMLAQKWCVCRKMPVQPAGCGGLNRWARPVFQSLASPNSACGNHQTSLRPSWIWREEVDVDPITPAFE